MAIQLGRQIITRVSPVIGGGVPPSGNHPVNSPFAGGFRPRVPNGIAGPGNVPTSGTVRVVGPGNGRVGVPVTQHQKVYINSAGPARPFGGTR
jgi:hypothetical protein